MRHGFTARAYEVEDNPTGGDITNADTLIEIGEAIKKGLVYFVHISVPCQTWTTFQNMNHTTRTKANPGGDGSLQREVHANVCMSSALWLVGLCLTHGVFFGFEHPITSRIWDLSVILLFKAIEGVFTVQLDFCAWCMRPSDWLPSHGDVRVKRGVIILTNLPHLEALRKRCSDVVPHRHEPIIGTDAAGNLRSDATKVYPQLFCRAYARAIRTAWLEKRKAQRHPTAYQKLTELRKLIPCQLGPVAIQSQVSQKPQTTGGGSASSSGSNAAPADTAGMPAVPAPVAEQGGAEADAGVAPPPPAQQRDFWVETPTAFIRIHKRPRRQMYVPPEEQHENEELKLDLEQVKTLGLIRTTLQVYPNGSTKTVQSNWQDPGHARQKFRSAWTGRSTFQKKAKCRRYVVTT